MKSKAKEREKLIKGTFEYNFFDYKKLSKKELVERIEKFQLWIDKHF